MVKIKNADSSDHTWVGQTIVAGQYHIIDPTTLTSWQNDSTLLTAIGDGLAVVNDGTNDLTNVSTGINWLLGIDSTPKDTDGSPLTRGKVTQTGWSYQLHSVEFKTSQLDSIYAKDASGTSWGHTTIKCYNDETTESSNQTDADSNCVKTVIDWEPTYDYEIIGGLFKQKAVPTNPIRLWVIAVPDISAGSGGSKLFVAGVNLQFIGLEDGIRVDGRATKRLAYNATYHTNKMRMILRHNAGDKHDLNMIFEIFKP